MAQNPCESANTASFLMEKNKVCILMENFTRKTMNYIKFAFQCDWGFNGGNPPPVKIQIPLIFIEIKIILQMFPRSQDLTWEYIPI